MIPPQIRKPFSLGKITDEYGGPMESEFDLDRPIPTDSTVRLPASKPRGGARILSFLLQAVVMAVALSLFFLFAGVAALLLLHLFVAGRALRRRRRRILNRSPNPSPNPNTSPFGLSPRDLKALPCFGFRSSGAMTSSTDCSVCLDGFRDGDRCRNLPLCGHSFHRDCVDRWLMRSPGCPICRRGVASAVVCR